MVYNTRATFGVPNELVLPHSRKCFDIYPWYGIRTLADHENIAAAALRSKGYAPYVPTYRVSGHDVNPAADAQYPLFPGYVFCRFNSKKRLPILMSSGVVSIVGYGTEPAPIPDDEIEAICTALRAGVRAEPCGYSREGQRVRLIRGSLAGVKGTLVRKKSQLRMVLSVTMLQRSISIEIDDESLDII